jgi:hypothetical protein
LGEHSADSLTHLGINGIWLDFEAPLVMIASTLFVVGTEQQAA